MTEWTTRILPSFTEQFGVSEVHTVCLAPPNWPGKGPTCGLGIPECEFQACFLDDNGEPIAIVNRPKNQNVKYWMRYTCEMANENAALLMFHCDTVEQAQVAARRAAKLLPHYQRIALERMYDAKTRAHSNLS